MLGNIAAILNLSKLKGRSKIVLKNALMSLALKGAGILISFVFVPLYLQAVGQRQFGIILTITSISNFISFFDVGIGNGLRVKLGKAIANNDQTLGRQYVSTAYYYVTILFSSVFVLYCIVSHWIKWYKILNIPSNEIAGLDALLVFIIGFYALLFIFNLLGAIFMADQKSSKKDVMVFTGNFLLITICITLKAMHLLNFYVLTILMCGLPVLVQFVYSLIFFSRQYRWLRPSLKFVNHSLRGDLLGLGVKFFLIQIVGLTIFSTTNILIAQLFKVDAVTQYNIAFKYYNITVIVFNILMSPLWGAFTNAWHQNDVKWISKNIKLYLGLIFVLIGVNIGQFFIYPYFIKIWLKRDFFIPFMLSVSLIMYNVVLCYNDVFAHFLAGIGKLNKQVYAAVIGGALNIPVTIYLAKFTTLGLSSILIANILCLLPSTFITTLETVRLIAAKKKEQNIDEQDVNLALHQR